MAYIQNTASRASFSVRLNLIARVRTALQLRKTRQDLAALSDSQLQDIGITRKQAREEAQKTLWNAPNHWFS